MKVTKDINLFQFKALLDSGLSLTDVYLLEMIDDNKSVLGLGDCITMSLYNLEGMGFIDEHHNITLEGKNFLKDVYSKDLKLRAKKKTPVTYDKRFEDWWNEYPPIDKFDDFSGSRTLRNKKDDCHELYVEILKEGRFTHQELLDCVRIEVEARKQDSYNKLENQLTFMKATSSYLNSRQFENYIAEVRKGKKQRVVDKGTVTF